jgi:hypothetical protein
VGVGPEVVAAAVAAAAAVGVGPQAAAAVATAEAAPEAAVAAAAAQQSAVDYLPSLAIFGRCCLQWAEQLTDHADGLLLLAYAKAQQQRQQDIRPVPELHAESAPIVCIPGLRPGKPGVPVDRLESFIETLSQWVRGVEAPAVLKQLAAAACSPQQLQQQLDALLAAQQGTWQGLTDASLAALVQQLRVTGLMLCSIAVPHFCNQPCVWEPQRSHRGAAGVRAQLPVCGVPYGPLLWARVSAGCLEAADARVQGAGSRDSSSHLVAAAPANRVGQGRPCPWWPYQCLPGFAACSCCGCVLS